MDNFPRDGLLAVALLQQDIEILRATKDTATDLDLAINLYEQELENEKCLLDQIQGLIITDTDENLSEHELVDELERRNNESTMAIPLTVDKIPTVTETIPTDISVNAEFEEFDDFSEPGPSIPITKKRYSFFKEKCDSCLEFSSSVHKLLTCRHTYCNDCLSNLFNAATTDESLLPVRCCGQELNEEISLKVLSTADFQLYNLRLLEFKTPDKLYCPVPTCSRFIPISNMNTEINCPDCNATICVECKQLQHLGQCEAVLETTELQQLARSQGWQQCRSCKRYVELHIGCYHITCRCSYEFCYACGAEWKTCNCPQWEENRLLETARERVINADAGLLVQHVEERARQFAEYLRVNHECAHHWNYQYRYGICGHCSFNMRIYSYECEHCLLRACFTCVHHRLR